MYERALGPDRRCKLTKMRHILIVAALAACNQTKRDPHENRRPRPELERIADGAKHAFSDKHAFPTGTAKVLPARNGETSLAAGCCGSKSAGDQVDHKCPVSTEWASDPVWKQLGFSLDEPIDYRFSYESADGKSFVVRAAGDADCDGEEAVFQLKGSVDAGEPKIELVLPPKNIY
jgi:hypothetical protein